MPNFNVMQRRLIATAETRQDLRLSLLQNDICIAQSEEVMDADPTACRRLKE